MLHESRCRNKRWLGVIQAGATGAHLSICCLCCSECMRASMQAEAATCLTAAAHPATLLGSPLLLNL